jgi:hypothetical protein
MQWYYLDQLVRNKLFLITLCHWSNQFSNESDALYIQINPPTFEDSDLKPWEISEQLAVGSLVKTIRAVSHKDYPATFIIIKGNDMRTNANSKLPLSLPFRIDSRTGEMFLSESVLGRVSF